MNPIKIWLQGTLFIVGMNVENHFDKVQHLERVHYASFMIAIFSIWLSILICHEK